MNIVSLYMSSLKIKFSNNNCLTTLNTSYDNTINISTAINTYTFNVPVTIELDDGTIINSSRAIITSR